MDQARAEKFGKQTIRMSREALLQQAVEEPDLSWRVLITLNVFRLLVAALLLGLFFMGGEPRIFGDRYPVPFATSATIYLLLAIIFATSLRQRWASASLQAAIQVLVDILLVVALMHTSGGVGSGLGGLLIVFVGAGSLVLPGQLPAIMGAIATFGIMFSVTISGIRATSRKRNQENAIASPTPTTSASR